MLLNGFGGNVTDAVWWMSWKKVDNKTQIVRVEETVSGERSSLGFFENHPFILTPNSDLLEELDKIWPDILLHHFTTVQQRDYIAKLKEESREDGTACVQMDFAMNYSLFSQEEIQQVHFEGNEQVTIFTVHISLGETHRNLAFVSDYLKHSTAFVHHVTGPDCRVHSTHLSKCEEDRLRE